MIIILIVNYNVVSIFSDCTVSTFMLIYFFPRLILFLLSQSQEEAPPKKKKPNEKEREYIS